MVNSLIKCQTADYSDGEAILTLLKYDRTGLFVPKGTVLSEEFLRPRYRDRFTGTARSQEYENPVKCRRT